MKCKATATVDLPRLLGVEVVCVRPRGHIGSHLDPAYEVYWSRNSQGADVALATGDSLSRPQTKK